MDKEEYILKKLGVIGGMGPEATSYYYAKVIERTQATSDREHIDMIILSHASMPDRTEAVLTGQKDAFIQEITRDATLLEQLGVSNIAIPCNTSHCFIREIQAAAKVPVINMVNESVYCIQNEYPDVKKIGIMATDGTLEAGLYQHACEASGIAAAIPDEPARRAVMSLIYDDIKRGKCGDSRKFDRAYENLMEQGCDAVLLACTELSVFRELHAAPENCIDTMDVLVKESIIRSGAQLRSHKEI